MASKGTGRARQGTIRAGHWRGGGVIFGPTPRSYKVKTNRKVAKLAFRSSLSQLVLNKQLVVIDKIELSAPKTKEFVNFAKNIKVYGEKTVLVLPSQNKNVYLSARNIEKTFVITAAELNTYRILDNKKLVVTESSVAVLNNF